MKPLQRASYHFKRGEYDHVERLCAKILITTPDEPRAWQMRGLAALHKKNYEAAATYFQETLARQETSQGFVNLAVALLTLDKPEDAMRAVERALAIDPNNAGAYLNLAACHLRLHRFADAEQAAERSLALSPNWPKALDMLARIALKLGNAERAADLAKTALALDPTLSVSHRVLADIALRAEDYDLARAHYKNAVGNNPEDPETQGNFALFLARTGQYENAVAWYKQAVKGSRDDASLQHGLAYMLLIHGRFEEGWPLYSWRHLRNDDSLQLVDQAFPSRLPAGEGATVVLDQGVGDQILMASMIPDLAAQVGELNVECDARLIGLFQRSFPSVRFAPTRVRSTQGAAATPGSLGMADVGRWLRPSFDSFPHHSGYLEPNPALKQELRERYAQKSGPLIGVSWATRRGAKMASQKSLPLASWGPLLSMPGVTFVNLQYDTEAGEVAAAARQFGANIITDPTISPNGDLDIFAAQVAAMDLVITTSSAAAHMAGAVGVPTWVFVPTGFGALWHWFLNREDSPWYPSVRLFRQTTRGQWADVVDRASTELLAFVDNWSAQSS